MKKEQIQQMRSKIKDIAERVVSLFNEINNVMEEIPHENGTVVRSLKPKSLEYVFHSGKYTSITCRHSDGKLYQVTYKEVKGI